jgi:rhamnogalacturonyl hydrolase YesR
VWGDELTAATGDPRYAALTVKAADSYRSRGKGQAPEPTSPNFQVEDMFFAGILLGRAFGITGKDDYIDIQTDFLINTETQQADGLFWHSRAAPYYWGRGNGFAAMGLTEALTFLPDDHPDSGKIVSMISRQMNAVRDLQAPSGMFRQVIDSLGAYQEFTCTCMIGYSIARGVRMGWLDRSLSEVATRAWRGVSERIDDKGNVVDACIGTGGQTSVRAYLDRPAASGFDDRSGSMALWFGTEMERLSREGPKP